jgi:hypothetical protein
MDTCFLHAQEVQFDRNNWLHAVSGIWVLHVLEKPSAEYLNIAKTRAAARRDEECIGSIQEDGTPSKSCRWGKPRPSSCMPPPLRYHLSLSCPTSSHRARLFDAEADDFEAGPSDEEPSSGSGGSGSDSELDGDQQPGSSDSEAGEQGADEDADWSGEHSLLGARQAVVRPLCTSTPTCCWQAASAAAELVRTPVHTHR